MFIVLMCIPSFLHHFSLNSFVYFFKSFTFCIPTLLLFSLIFSTSQYRCKCRKHVFFIYICRNMFSSRFFPKLQHIIISEVSLLYFIYPESLHLPSLCPRPILQSRQREALQ